MRIPSGHLAVTVENKHMHMKRLFIFAIGGTGARIIKALVMLLAAGVKLKEEFEIVPILIDPHASNDNFQQAIKLLDDYETIRGSSEGEVDFFKTKISSLKSLSSYTERIKNWEAEIPGTQTQKFRNFIGFDTLSDASQALVRALYSNTDREIDLDIGFVGNPHIGSVVMNQFRYSDEIH